MLIEIDFDDGNVPRQIKNKCHRVCIYNGYGWLWEDAVNKIAKNKGGYRTVVMRYFSCVIEK